MKKFILILLLSSFLSAQDWQNEWESKSWQFVWNPNKVIAEVDTTAPDTFDTPITLTLSPPNQFGVGWTPSDIDATDWKDLLLYFEGETGGWSPESPYTIPKATAIADSDTVIQKFIHYTGGPSGVSDTIHTMSIYAVLRDSSDNISTMSTIIDTFIVNDDVGMAVDSFSLTNENDSMLVNVSPNSWSTKNTWVNMEFTRFMFEVLKISDGENYLNISNATYIGRIGLLSLSEIEADSSIKIGAFEDAQPFEFFEDDSIFITGHFNITDNYNSRQVIKYSERIVLSDTILVVAADSDAPNPGTVAMDTLIPDYHLPLAITNSDSADAEAVRVEAKVTATDSYTTLKTILNNTTTEDTIAISEIIYYAGDDTLFIRLSWFDELSNQSAYAYDTLVPTAIQYVLYADSITADKIVFYINDDSIRTNMDSSMVLLSGDTLTGYEADTNAYSIPMKLIEQYATTYVRTAAIINDVKTGISNAVQYPAAGGDACPEDTLGVIADGTTNGQPAFFAWVNHVDIDNCADVVDTISARVSNMASGSSQFKLIIYAGDASDPGALLYESAAINTPDNTTQWYDDEADYEFAQTSHLWIGILIETADGDYCYVTEAGQTRRYHMASFSADANWDTGSDTADTTNKPVVNIKIN